MKRMQGTPRVLFVGLALAVFVVLGASSVATAASQRTFVRSNDADSGTCSLAAPCRSFNYAIGQTDAGGEVIILDTAGYGTIVINKSIKVIGPAGVYGGISVLGGGAPTIGVLINAGSGDDITLRGLVRDSTLAHVTAAIKTRGTNGSVSLIRSQINNCTIAVDHGAGVVRLDDSHVVKCADDFLNNGSGNIVSSGRNIVHDVDNLPGFTYITPATIVLK